MKTYMTYEELKTEAATTMAAFNRIQSLAYGLLSPEGSIRYDAYDYINDFFIESTNEVEFIEKAYQEYRELVKHYEMLSEYEKKTTWNNPRVHLLIRRYVRHNFRPELREAYPEFASPAR